MDILKRLFIFVRPVKHAKRCANNRGEETSAIVPPYLGHSVAIDLFRLPETVYEGKRYDSNIVCVDRLSGWIVAVPGLDKGLTGASVAKTM